MKNPASLAYLYPSIPTKEISRRWQRYHEEVLENALEGMLLIFDSFAIGGSHLSTPLKQRYQANALKIGTHTYYLLPHASLPRSKRTYFRTHPERRIYKEDPNETPEKA